MTLFATSIPCRLGAAPPGHSYRITGVAVSSRDGAPVPYCRISATLAAAKQIVSKAAAESSGQRGNGGGGGRQPGQNGGRPGGNGNRFGAEGGGSASQTPEVTADAGGHFTLDLPHAGAWRLTATARNFRGQSYEEHDGFYEAVVLTDAAPDHSVTFKLAPDSVFTGLIFDDAGEPVTAAQVTAELVPPPTPGLSANADAERPRPVGFAQTDDRGHYEIGSLQPGNYRIKVQAQPWYSSALKTGAVRVSGNAGLVQADSQTSAQPLDPPLDFVFPLTWFPGADDEAAAQTIALAAGEERHADFHLTAIPSVHLRIPRTDNPSAQQSENARGRQGQQPQRQQVIITRVSVEGAGPEFQQPLAQGLNGNDWDYGGLSPGIYEVRTPGADGRAGGEVRQIEVRSGSQTVITLDSAKPMVPVTIKIDGAAEADVQIIEFVDTETGRRIASNPPFRGRRWFDGGDDDDAPEQPQSTTRTVMLPPHQYEVYITGGAALALTGMNAVGAKVQGRVLTVAGAAALTLHLSSGKAQLDGVAKLEGSTAAAAMVLLVPITLGQPGDLNAVQRDETNSDGTFLFPAVTPGRYILLAIDRGWGVDWRNQVVLTQYLMHGVPVDLRTAAKAHEEIQASAP